MSSQAATIERFLAGNGWAEATRQDLAGDASSRRYQRLRRAGDRAVLMIGGASGGQVAPFLAVQRILSAAGLSVPAVLAADPDGGLMLLEDFGDDTYARLLDQGDDPLPLYRLAIDALVHLHRRIDVHAPEVFALPRYDDATWIDIVGLFADSYVPAHGEPPTAEARAEYDAIWRELLRPLDAVPASLLLRDFHAGNLFRLDARPGIGACGLIDFQDAGVGCVLYDPISLLEDARRDLDAALVADCQARYRTAFPELDADVFARAWHALALQRHLRVVAVFDRLARNGDERYLVHMPRLWGYVTGHLGAADAGPQAGRLAGWLARHLPDRSW
jgi:aminoglycoside/choline kinase family phosphotransferase